MDDHYPSVISEEERRARRAQRAAARRKKQLERRRRMLRQLVPAGALALAVVVLLSAWGLQKKPEAAAIEPEEPVAAVQPAQHAGPRRRALPGISLPPEARRLPQRRAGRNALRRLAAQLKA